MVPLVLVRVATGEAPHGLGEYVALPYVGVDGRGVAGAGVGPGERVAAGNGELDEDGRDEFGGGDQLHIAELTDVEVTLPERPPTHEDVGGALHHPLAGDDPGAVVVVPAGVGVGLVDGGTGLLALQEERVPGRAPFEEHEVHHHADAADPDHLADDVHRGEAVEEPAAVFLECEAVLPEETLHDVALLVVVQGHAQWGLWRDACPPTPLGGQLLERAAARPRVLVLLELHLYLAAVGRFEVVDELVEARALVPDVEKGQGGVVPHPVAIGVDRGRDRGICLRGFYVVLPRRHHQAGGQAGHVPLEGTGQRLVEVAQVEVEVALRCGPETEVQDVGVTAELDLDPAVRPGGEVGRHHRGGAAVEVPR